MASLAFFKSGCYLITIKVNFYNTLQFLNLKVVLGITNAFICFFSITFSFLMSVFEARWFDEISLKFPAFINKLLEKNKSISSTDGFF